MKGYTGDFRWSNNILWSNLTDKYNIDIKWDKDTINLIPVEHIIILSKTRSYYRLEHASNFDFEYNQTYLCIKRGNQIIYCKIGTTIHTLIGKKYLELLLKDKYKVAINEVYLDKRWKVI